MKEEKESRGGMLIALCTICYFISYLTRINYGTVLLEVERAEGISKVAASMAVTGSFITYGAGQLISGWLGDRLKPEKMILAGLLTTAGMNLLVPIFTEPGMILVFWCINGFAQAMIWPPMVRIMSACPDGDTYKKAVVRVTWGSSAGTIAVYLLAPACIRWKGWKSLFFLCAAGAICFAVVWIKGVPAAMKRAGEARNRADDLEEEAAAQTRRTLEEFRSRYSKLMSDFEAASGHVNGELRKIEVTLSQLPRALDQTGAQLNELAARLEKKPEEKG